MTASASLPRSLALDDATQKLVAEARALREAARVLRGEFQPLVNRAPDWRNVERQLLEAADALEAAQRPPGSGGVDWSDTDRPHCARCGERIWAGQKMTVLPSGFREHQDCACPYQTPEVREAIRAVVGEQLTKAGLDLNGPPYSDDGETQWPVALELRDCLTAALLARFSVPSQPVYDEEKIARFLTDARYPEGLWMSGSREPREASDEEIAAALVAALRGGELTREETNG